jgi:hypothetical protein
MNTDYQSMKSDKKAKYLWKSVSHYNIGKQ